MAHKPSTTTTKHKSISTPREQQEMVADDVALSCLLDKLVGRYTSLRLYVALLSGGGSAATCKNQE
jgi:hypothetical protein